MWSFAVSFRGNIMQYRSIDMHLTVMELSMATREQTWHILFTYLVIGIHICEKPSSVLFRYCDAGILVMRPFCVVAVALLSISIMPQIISIHVISNEQMVISTNLVAQPINATELDSKQCAHTVIYFEELIIVLKKGVNNSFRSLTFFSSNTSTRAIVHKTLTLAPL